MPRYRLSERWCMRVLLVAKVKVYIACMAG